MMASQTWSVDGFRACGGVIGAAGTLKSFEPVDSMEASMDAIQILYSRTSPSRTSPDAISVALSSTLDHRLANFWSSTSEIDPTHTRS